MQDNIYSTQMTYLRLDGTQSLPCKFFGLKTYRFIVLTCILGPYSRAFPDSYTGLPLYLDYVMNIFFGLDVILNFFCAYYDSDFQIVDDYKV